MGTASETGFPPMLPDSALPVSASLMTLLASFAPLLTARRSARSAAWPAASSPSPGSGRYAACCPGPALSRAWSHDRRPQQTAPTRSRSSPACHRPAAWCWPALSAPACGRGQQSRLCGTGVPICVIRTRGDGTGPIPAASGTAARISAKSARSCAWSYTTCRLATPAGFAQSWHPSEEIRPSQPLPECLYAIKIAKCGWSTGPVIPHSIPDSSMVSGTAAWATDSQRSIAPPGTAQLSLSDRRIIRISPASFTTTNQGAERRKVS